LDSGGTNVDLDASSPTLRVRRTLQRVNGALTDGEPKSRKSRRTIALSSLAVEALKRHRAAQNKDRLRAGRSWRGSDFIFTTVVGERMDPRNLLRQWYKLLDRAELPNRPLHDARHGAASLMLSQGVPLKVVQETLGQSTIRLTADLYGHQMPGDAEKVAEAVDRALA
jgi:integrase